MPMACGRLFRLLVGSCGLVGCVRLLTRYADGLRPSVPVAGRLMRACWLRSSPHSLRRWPSAVCSGCWSAHAGSLVAFVPSLATPMACGRLFRLLVGSCGLVGCVRLLTRYADGLRPSVPV